MTEINTGEIRSTLGHFTGTENWYRHSLARSITYTDGVKYVGEACGAYWLIDKIAILNQFEGKFKSEEFQVWTFSVNTKECVGVLTAEDGNGNVVHTEKLDYTDFPLDEIKFYFTNNVIMLPSEY
jgi:hypothetical protein